MGRSLSRGVERRFVLLNVLNSVVHSRLLNIRLALLLPEPPPISLGPSTSERQPSCAS
jgi:hypothetical protein